MPERILNVLKAARNTSVFVLHPSSFFVYIQVYNCCGRQVMMSGGLMS